MSLIDDIDSAAWGLKHGLIDGLYTVSNNFTIVANHNYPCPNSRFDVYSYTTLVAFVNKNENGDWDTFVERDAFHHSTTTSRYVRRFLSAMVGRVDWDALYKACSAENAPQYINVREVA